jgi:hypothetical protein
VADLPGRSLDPEGSIVEPLAQTRWTRDRFHATLDRFLQQESTFWRRGLWERAGAHVSEELLSCDHELWARFFRHARLFQTPGLIGAFRHRREQRSVLHRKRYLEEARATLARERAAAAPPPLADRDAELFSEIRFDAETMAFARRDSRDLASSAERAFVHLDHALAETLGVVSVATPPWGFERSPQIRERLPELAAKRPSSFTFLWLGSGEAEGLRLALRSWDTQSVELRLTVAPGPSRPDSSARSRSRCARSRGASTGSAAASTASSCSPGASTSRPGATSWRCRCSTKRPSECFPTATRDG